ncbi:MAG: hypothetical protein P8Y44_06285, partial [Acidobacteriota bacterium]
MLSFLSPVTDSIEFHEETALGKAYDSSLMVRLLGYVAPYRRSVVIAVLLIIVSSLLQLVGPLATAVALDLYIRPFQEDPQVASAASRWVETELERRQIEVSPAAGLGAVSLVYLASLLLAFVVLYFQGYVMQ